MTEEQKDAIVRAAKELCSHIQLSSDLAYAADWDVRVKGKLLGPLVAAVRAAEQPRWITRLLNEDEKKA